MNTRAWYVIGSALLTVAIITSFATLTPADYEAGVRASEEGHQAKALAQWRTAAEAGDPQGMLYLARSYLKGLNNLPEDYVLAYMWFSLAASLGEMEAVDEAEALAAKMTPRQRAMAQERAGIWLAFQREEKKHKEYEGIWPAGKVFRDCTECPEMVVIPSGGFRMGSPRRERGRKSNEGPRREVTIKTPFAVGKYEVTRDQYATFVAETGHDTVGGCLVWNGKRWKEDGRRWWRDPGFNQTGTHPVVCVGWHDARAYVEWLSGRTGHQYLLLSESKWEYAARAGSETPRHWEAEYSRSEAGTCRYANGAGSKTSFRWRNTACDDGYRQTAPVGSFSPNAWGLYDMIGNVWEWVEDCVHGYSGAPSDGSSWTSGGDCGRHLYRGGSWSNNPKTLRSAARGGDAPGHRGTAVGFRVARTLTL